MVKDLVKDKAHYKGIYLRHKVTEINYETLTVKALDLVSNK